MISAATAIKLKEKGFPQPEPSVGQNWCSGSYSWYIGGIDRELFGGNKRAYMCVSDEHVSYLRRKDFDDFAFAPTATDILRELNDPYWYMNFEDNEFAFSQPGNPIDCSHKDPDEAAALLYLNQ